MRQDLKLEGGALAQAAPGAGTVRVYLDPTAEERAELRESLGIDDHTLASALDPDEIARLEHEAGTTFLIWKRPNNVSLRALHMFEVSSLGFFVRPDRLTVVAAEPTDPFTERRIRNATTPWDVVLQTLLGTVSHYLGHLRVIRMMSRDLQAKLNTSLANEYLLKMFALSESLTYYLNGIAANDAVLARIRSLAEPLGLTRGQLALLDDLVIENQQCARQAEIYTTVLAGLMDARGNIINNNMNVLLKNLTLINVVFLPLGVLAGVGGMSEFSRWTANVPWPVSYGLFLAGLAASGVLLWWVLSRYVNRPKHLGAGAG